MNRRDFNPQLQRRAKAHLEGVAQRALTQRVGLQTTTEILAAAARARAKALAFLASATAMRR